MSSLPPSTLIRRMTPADLDRVMEIAESLKEAPQWPRSAYMAALESEAAPPRIALVVEGPAGAKAPVDSVGFMRGLKPPPPSESRRSAGAKARFDCTAIAARLKSCPDTKPDSISSSSAACAEGEIVRVVGFAVASLLPPEAELEMIAVAPTAQRRGLARQLFFSLAAELRTAEVFGVILEVRAANQPALELYRQLGFVETGHRPRYYHDPVEDAILMRLRL